MTPLPTAPAQTPRPTLLPPAVAPSVALRVRPTAMPFEDLTKIRVEPWTDHVTAEFGHDPRSGYVERFWLSTVGPSALWLLRTFAYGFDSAPDGYQLDVHNVARALGLGDRTGRHSPVQRAVDRLCHFDLAYVRGNVTLVVRREVPWLDERKVSRLPAPLRVEHDDWESAELAQSAMLAARRRAASIAIACARSGGTADDIAQQLTTWRYPATGVAELTAWALEQVAHGSSRRSA